MYRAIAEGLAALAFWALMEMLFIGMKWVEITRTLDLTGNVTKAPVWALIAVPFAFGLLGFSHGLRKAANIADAQKARALDVSDRDS